MVQHRRDFIQLGGLGLLALLSKGQGGFLPSESRYTGLSDPKGIQGNKLDFELNPEIIYLNNGTMGPSPRMVMQAMTDRLNEVNSNGVYGGGDHEAIQAIADLVKADKTEIAFTHNVTEGINIAAWGLPLKSGDEVILSNHEHVGNAGPWLNLARLKGIKIKVMPYGKTADETIQIFKKSVTRKTRVLAIPHIPCTTGLVAPMKELCSIAAARNIITVVDGAHGTGMLNLNLAEMGCDVYVSCCHKWLLGPKGTGYIYVRKEFQNKLESIFSGAYSTKDWVVSREEVRLDGLVDNAHKYYFGTQSSELYYGVVAAVHYHQTIGVGEVEQRIRNLNDYLFNSLNDLKGISILTPAEASSRCGVVSFRFEKLNNKDFFDTCAKKKKIIRYVPEGGLDCIRVSTHLYNSLDDVDAILSEVRQVL